MKSVVRKISSLLGAMLGNQRLLKEIEETKILAGRLMAMQVCKQPSTESLAKMEFKVFSQFRDDGIIQYLIHQLDIEPTLQVFIEFGVQNYTESNTRFLLLNNNWRGLVMDSSKSNINYIRKDGIYWRHDLTAVHAWIDRDNINDLIQRNGIAGEIGILSIDIDGNDYWVWERITIVNPIIVIVEYNSVFGAEHAVTVPYDPVFCRAKAHFSNLYWGCSLKALHILADKKGYAFVGSNSAGNNAYFVRRDRLRGLTPLPLEAGYVQSKFRESRDEGGRLSYLHGEQRLRAIREMPLYDLEKERIVSTAELFRI